MGIPNSKTGGRSDFERAFELSHYRNLIIKSRQITYRKTVSKKKDSHPTEIIERMSINEFNRFINGLSSVYGEFQSRMQEFYELLHQVENLIIKDFWL